MTGKLSFDDQHSAAAGLSSLSVSNSAASRPESDFGSATCTWRRMPIQWI